jgi:alpha-1,6-mannosyltransferase
MAVPLEEPTRDRAPGSRRAGIRASLTGEVAYVGMLCSTFFLYLSLAMISLAPINTLGKNSPIQVAAYRNDFLRGVIQSLGLDRASLTTLRVSAFVVIGLLIVAYAWAIYIFRNREDKRLGSILMLTAGISAVLILVPPLLSKDIFSNIYYGRIKSVYGANPYTLSPQKFLNDSVLPFTSTYWKNTPIVYGPFYTLFSMGLVKLTGEGVMAGIYASKLSLALFHLGNTLLIWKLLGRFYPDRQVLGTMLYAWNPLVLVTSIGGGHNDVMMAFFAILSLYLVMAEHPWAAVLSMTLSTMTKYATVILLVALVIYLVRQRALWRERLKVLLVCLLIVLAVSALLFAPFWEGFSTLRTTADNLQLRTPFSTGNVLTVCFKQFFHHVLRMPLDAADDWGSKCARAILSLIFLGLFAKFTLRCRSREDLVDNWAWIMVAFLATSSYLLPWYMVWVIPLLALREWDRLTKLWLSAATVYMFAGNDWSP